MTLLELSALYDESATRHPRTDGAASGRCQGADGTPAAAQALRQRIAELTPLLREMRELAVLTAHYYDRSYHKHERYTL